MTTATATSPHTRIDICSTARDTSLVWVRETGAWELHTEFAGGSESTGVTAERARDIYIRAHARLDREILENTEPRDWGRRRDAAMALAALVTRLAEAGVRPGEWAHTALRDAEGLEVSS